MMNKLFFELINKFVAWIHLGSWGIFKISGASKINRGIIPPILNRTLHLDSSLCRTQLRWW